jgi:hypothetical protein
MKRVVVYTAMLIFLVLSFVHADEAMYPGANNEIISYKVAVSANAAAVPLPHNFVGAYLYPVEIISTLDDALTVSLATALGTSLGTKTTTAATSGEWLIPAIWYPLTSLPTYTVSGLGSGSVTLVFSGVRVRK